MSVKVSPGGLFGLVMKISEELKENKSFDDILSKYPVSKTALPYLLTLQEEYSKMFLDFVREEYAPLEKENNTLKEQIKRLESKKGVVEGVDIEMLQNELKRLEIENKQLQEDIEELKKENIQLKNELADIGFDVDDYEMKLSRYESFFETHALCAMFYKNYLRKYSQG